MENDPWMKVRVAARASIVTAAVALVAVIVWVNIMPFRIKISYDINLAKTTEHVSVPSPLKSSATLGTDSNQDVYQVEEMVMAADQVSFSLETPYDHLSRLTFQVEYGGDPEELGLGLVNPADGKMIYEPLHNKSLNDLGWPAVSDGSTTLFQRSGAFVNPLDFVNALYASSDEFFNLPGNQVAFYGYPLDPVYIGLDAKRANEGSFIRHAFRGKHALLVYTDGEPLDLRFNYRDLNWQDGSDGMNISVFLGSSLVHAQAVPDDGNISADGKPSDREIRLNVPDLAPGVYRVALSCGDDVIISDIISGQKYISFAENVFLADNEIYGTPSKNAVLFTNAKVLNAQAWYPATLQSLLLNGQEEFSINKTDTVFSVQMNESVNEVTTQDGGLTLSSPGACFAFWQDSLFYPIKESPYSRSLLTSDLGYVIADYQLPVRTEDAWKQEVTFDMSGIALPHRKIDILLLAPGSTGNVPVAIKRITAVAE